MEGENYPKINKNVIPPYLTKDYEIAPGVTVEQYKSVTGFNTPEEWAAYEKGREDEMKVVIAWINKWKGEINSEMGTILHNKFNELKKK
jgi:hypothetical protein